MAAFIFSGLVNLAPEMAVARESKTKDFQTFTLHFEDDNFFGMDSYYTSGMKLSWSSPDLENYRDTSRIGTWAYCLIGRLPFTNKPELQRSVSLAIGQNIYTPEDTESRELIEDDRPYAGLTYVSAGLHSKNSLQMNTWELVLGIVGPHSYAEDAQKTIHRWVDNDIPKGWRHQLRDEGVFNIFFERRRKLLRSGTGGGWGSEIIPNWGVGLGNLFIGAHAGAQIRFGWNLPNDFGKSLIRPGSDTNAPFDKRDPRTLNSFHRLGTHVFAGVDGAYVLRNVTLDGNTFRKSHNVEKEPIVSNFMIGLGFTINRLKTNFAHVYQIKAFETQEEEEQYGSVTLSLSEVRRAVPEPRARRRSPHSRLHF